MGLQAGTSTGRAIGCVVGANLASFTAELGGKVSQFLLTIRILLLSCLRKLYF